MSTFSSVNMLLMPFYHIVCKETVYLILFASDSSLFHISLQVFSNF